MATVSKWTPFDVALDITATGSTVTRTSATKFTVRINASWETYYSGAQTNYGMVASSGGGSVTLNPFGTKASSGSGSFVGTYTISGNGSATKTITVAFRNFNTDNGNSATKNVTFNVTVPAWTSYTIAYNANGGSGAPGSQTKWKDQALTLSSTKPTRTGYSFLGWSTSSSATTATYSAGGSYTANSAATLYAVWKANTYTVAYNANGGTGAPANQTKTYGKTLTLSSTKPTRTNYNFLGWATSSSATSATYSAGGSYTANAAVTLYAVWSLAYVKPRITNFSATRCDVDNLLPATNSEATTTSGITISATDGRYTVEGTTTGIRILNIVGSTTSYPDNFIEGETYTVLYHSTERVYLRIYQTDSSGSSIALNTRTHTTFTVPSGFDGLMVRLQVATGSAENPTVVAPTTVYPRIGKLVADDEGVNALVSFEWESDREVTAITIEWKKPSATTWNTTTVSATGTSGVVSQLIGTDDIDTESSHDIRVTVTDSGGSTDIINTLASMKLVLDAKAGGNGIAFGKTAELEDTAEFEFEAKFNSPVYGKALGMDRLPAIPANSNANDYMEPGCYAIQSNAIAATCDNIPVPRAGRLEVWSSTGEGVRKEQWSYLRQRYIPYNSANAVYERDVTRSEDNVWRYYDWYRTSLTPAAAEFVYHEPKILWGETLTSGMYMTAGHTVNLSEAVSAQRHGIVLVFSAYNGADDTNYGWQSFFVPKQLVALSTSGHTFTLSRGKFTYTGTKYLYINDTSITGHADNNLTGESNGITYTNNKFVLRYVIGV